MKRTLRTVAWCVSALPAIALVLTIIVGIAIRVSFGRWPTYDTYYTPPDPISLLNTLSGVFTGLTVLSLLPWPFVEIVVANVLGRRCAQRQAAVYLLSLVALVGVHVADPGGFSSWLLD